MKRRRIILSIFTNWTNKNIGLILAQLDNQMLPFEKYCFAQENGIPILLGRGAFANVYKAQKRNKKKDGYAIKVIGFGDRHIDSENFRTVVATQRNLGFFQNNIVKIFDSTELRVWIEEDYTIKKVEKVDSENLEEECSGEFLHLQFIVMEEVSPILIENEFGNPSLTNQKLSSSDEDEILKLAYDIGLALKEAHLKNIIHRDIKLENIFYSDSDHRYKLGDFGISCITDDGMASTVAFTKGYGAPEVVGTLEDKYDCTADIYSFGMTLYVLINKLRFPSSKNYHPNIEQYKKGFVATAPENGSAELCGIVLKMICYDPDDRYQTMDEVLNGLEWVKFGERAKFQRNHKDATLTFGVFMANIGAVMYEYSYSPKFIENFTVVFYILWGLFIWKGINLYNKKHTSFISKLILGMSIFMIITKKITWWNFAEILFFSLCLPKFTAIIASSEIIMQVMHIIMKIKNITVAPQYAWISILLISISFLLLQHYFMINERDINMDKTCKEYNVYWFVYAILYAQISLCHLFLQIVKIFALKYYYIIFGKKIIDLLLKKQCLEFGIFGSAFCLLWIARETFLIKSENREKEDEYVS